MNLLQKIYKKIKKIDEKQEFLNYYESFKKEYLPPQYNQLNYIPFILDDDLTNFLELSNRSDGKTTSSFAFWLSASIKFEEIKLGFIVRHYELQLAIKQQILEIMLEFDNLFDSDKLFIQNYTDYTRVYYDDIEIALIYDLNNASDLKNHSAVLKKFPILIFDEFLALSEDYTTNEAVKLDLIYSSVDKISDRKMIKNPKVIYLANPINFDSEILSALDIFDVMEQMEINSYQIKGKTFVEMLRNDNANEKKNALFPSINKQNMSGEFNFNRYNLVSDNHYREQWEKYPKRYIKINDTQSLEIIYSPFPILKVVPVFESEHFCINKKDERNETIFLNEKFYNPKIRKKFEKNYFKFANNFTKNFVYNDSKLTEIKYNKLLTYFSDNDIIVNEEKIEQETQKFSILKRFKGYE